ncbi:MAG: hypothetical protein R6U78_07765 [Bacteroidales bacterium]
MKTRTTIRTMMLSVFLIMAGWFTACSDIEVDEIDLANNAQEKDVVFDQILHNETLLNEFLIRVKNDPESLHWMMENQVFMEDMFSEEHLEYIVEHNEGMDRYMVQHMSAVLEDHPSMMEHWDQMMGGQHMMDE